MGSFFNPPKINLVHFVFFTWIVTFGGFASYFWDKDHPFYPVTEELLKWLGIGLILYHSILFVVELAKVMSSGFENYRIFVYAFHIVLGAFCIAASMDAHKSPIKLLIGTVGIIGFIYHIIKFYTYALAENTE